MTTTLGRIAPATATAHLHRLIDGGLVRIRVQGRHPYHELAGPNVAVALEAIAQILPSATIRSLRQDGEQQAIVEAAPATTISRSPASSGAGLRGFG